MAKLAKAGFPNEANLKAVGDLIIAVIGDNDIVVNPEAALKTTVKFSDGSFKHRTIAPIWDFFITGCYIGKSQNLIFIGETSDQTPFDSDGRPIEKWQHAEFSVEELDKTFPMLLPQLSSYIDTRDTMAKTVRFLYDRMTVMEQMEEADSAVRLQDLPTYGMF